MLAGGDGAGPTNEEEQGLATSVARGHSLVVRTPRRGRGNPGSIPGDRFFKPCRAAAAEGNVDDEGFEPSTFRMQNGRSTTELNAQH